MPGLGLGEKKDHDLTHRPLGKKEEVSEKIQVSGSKEVKAGG